MTDYKNLIELLRLCSRQGTRYGYAAVTMADAADAIEEMGIGIDNRDAIIDKFRDEILTLRKQIPKHGEWKKISNRNDGEEDYECSACLGIILDVSDDDEHPLVRYCPMCGAKMEV